MTDGQKNGYRMLANAIIKQAVYDYRCKRIENYPTYQLERFFRSDWCDNLMVGFGLSGKDILNRLKNETRLECLEILSKSGVERWQELYKKELEELQNV